MTVIVKHICRAGRRQSSRSLLSGPQKRRMLFLERRVAAYHRRHNAQTIRLPIATKTIGRNHLSNRPCSVNGALTAATGVLDVLDFIGGRPALCGIAARNVRSRTIVR